MEKIESELTSERNRLAETQNAIRIEEKHLKGHQVKSLEAKIKEMETQLKEAGHKVDTSEKTVKDIALKAIENATRAQIVEKERSKE